MIARMMSCTIVLLFLAASSAAQETKTARITSAEAKTDPIESVIPELKGIVVLCAIEPQSEEFRQQWRNYVRRNNVSKADLGTRIFQIINDAEAYRGNHHLNRGESPDAARDRRSRIYRSMHDTAMAVIRKSG